MTTIVAPLATPVADAEIEAAAVSLRLPARAFHGLYVTTHAWRFFAPTARSMLRPAPAAVKPRCWSPSLPFLHGAGRPRAKVFACSRTLMSRGERSRPASVRVPLDEGSRHIHILFAQSTDLSVNSSRFPAALLGTEGGVNRHRYLHSPAMEQA